MNINRLETPSLIVEVKALNENIAAMKSILAQSELALRPHYKAHKCAALAHLQVKNGAKGLTCAKLSEAMDLADSGIDDILIANQIVDPRKLSRVAELAGDCRLTVLVDDIENVRLLSAAAKNANTKVHCLVEYDIGMQRCGVGKPDQALRLAEAIGCENHLEFDGIQAYAGHISHVTDISERKELTADNYRKLRGLLSLFAAKGIPVKNVSGGSTGTAQIKAAEGLYTELQAGSYLFMDTSYKALKLPFVNSLFLLSTVVSSRNGIVVIDAGVKTCGTDQGMPCVKGAKAEQIVASEEHFQLHGLSMAARVGDVLRLIPGHCCSTVNLHDRIYLVDDGIVVDRLAITARGCGK